MSTFQKLNQDNPKVIIDNEDDSFNLFIKLLLKSELLVAGKDYQQVRVKRTQAMVALGSKMKKIATEKSLYEGTYNAEYNGDLFNVVVERAQAKIVTECRMIDYLKRVCILGESLEKVKKFVDYIFSLAEDQKQTDMITIYENQGGYWRVSKEKKPRKLQSVIFKKEFIDSVLEDVNEFIESESWYTEMGVPYKRSYLLYGPPGTGKSSFAQAIAASVNFSICFVNCSDKINDFNFNSLLNQAPKKSIILIEDVDAIFSERKNTEKMNALTFSGFLNAIDGVRSQEGRIIIMTTNYKEKLDPALLRPGRVDESYEIGYASKYQMEKLCVRFYKNEKIAKEFAEKLPENKFSMSMIQGFLLKYRKCPQKIVEKVDDILNSDENVKIEVFLREINCQECLTGFRMEQVYSLAQAKNLPKAEVEKIASKLDGLRKGRLIETIRLERKNYIKSQESILKFIEEIATDEEKQRALRSFAKEVNAKTFFVVRDKLREMESEPVEKAEENKKD